MNFRLEPHHGRIRNVSYNSSSRRPRSQVRKKLRESFSQGREEEVKRSTLEVDCVNTSAWPKPVFRVVCPRKSCLV